MYGCNKCFFNPMFIYTLLTRETTYLNCLSVTFEFNCQNERKRDDQSRNWINLCLFIDMRRERSSEKCLYYK